MFFEASRISNRMAFIRRTDIERMLEENPYNRVIPRTRPKKNTSIVQKKPGKESQSIVPTSDDIPSYLSGEEGMSIYNGKAFVALHYSQAQPNP